MNAPKPRPHPSVDITIKHRYVVSGITPGRCGAATQVSTGHFICCGKPESHETHNQAKCQVCRYHFTPTEEPLCPNCAVYVPEAFEVILKQRDFVVRSAILTVIDDGCQKHWKQPWLLNADDEALANDERLRFCDAVAAQINKTTKTRRANARTR